jgi:hypothetical protein
MQYGRQFEYEVTLDSEVGLELSNSEMDWFATFSCMSPWLSSTFLMLHLSSVVVSLIPNTIKSLGSNRLSIL